jgi:hypothetical protein
LIGVTAPAVTQLTEAGKASTSYTVSSATTSVVAFLGVKQPIYSENSDWNKSAN